MLVRAIALVGLLGVTGCSLLTSDDSITADDAVVTPLFKDSSLTFTVGDENVTDHVAMMTSWDSNDSIENTTNRTAARITFGSHPAGWSGAVSLVQVPSKYTGTFYDFTHVSTIKFMIRSADIDPANLTFEVQTHSTDDHTSTLSALGVESMTDWTTVTVDVSGLFGEDSLTDVKAAFAFFWGSSASDSVSIVTGNSFEISDIEFLTSDNTDANFYSNLAVPAVTAPSAAASVPDLTAEQVTVLYSSLGEYDLSPVSAWGADWGGGAAVEDFSIPSTSSTVKKYTSLGYTGVEFYDNPVDAETKKYFHADLFVIDGTSFELAVVDLSSGNPIQATIVVDTVGNLVSGFPLTKT